MQRGKYKNVSTGRPSITDVFEPTLIKDYGTFHTYNYSEYSVALFFKYPETLDEDSRRYLTSIGGVVRSLYPFGRSQPYRIGWLFKRKLETLAKLYRFCDNFRESNINLISNHTLNERESQSLDSSQSYESSHSRDD